jgi:hypothetical protein
MVTARAADVTALSVTGQISRLTSRLEPIASLACTHGRADTPRQFFGHVAECESEWSMDWVTQRNTRHVGVESYVHLRVMSVSWCLCPFHQGRSGFRGCYGL